MDIKFIQGDATKIPLDSNHVEAISIAYGLRNIKEPHLCIKEAFRTLKPGSPFGILELTEPKFKILKDYIPSIFNIFYLLLVNY